MEKNYIWTDKYKPKTLDDIVSHKLNIKILELLIKKGNLPHTIFYGKSGIGKTSTIYACAKKIYNTKINSRILELNASDERGIEVIRSKIKTFASTTNLFNTGIKLVILDEADLMTSDAQIALKKIIELYIKNCRFCIICNNINKLIPEIQSRCMKIRFEPIKNEHALDKLTYICKQESIKITDTALNVIIENSNNDLRKMINMLQSVSIINKSNITKVNVYKFLNIMNSSQEEVFKKFIKNNTYIQIYELLSSYITTYNYSIVDIINLIYKFIQQIDSIDSQNSELLLDNIINLADLEYRISCGIDNNIVTGYIVSILWNIKHIIVDK